ncbi:MAG: hypothetical protein RLZZ316_2073 [Bacteroidota bacterium]
MTFSKNTIHINNVKPIVLVAPLDWGLGHTTRCIPIIQELLANGFEVVIACNAQQERILKNHFPFLTYYYLKGYGLTYGKNKWQTILKLLFSIPKILTAIKKEKSWLNSFIKSKHLDLLISDNRYGLSHNQIASIFITHQLLIKTGFGFFSEQILQRINYSFINRFSYCWVPDYASEKNLAGALSHPIKKPAIPVKYIGALSRLNPVLTTIQKESLLAVLSGPEPQRSILESEIIKQLTDINIPAVLIRGLSEEVILPKAPGNIQVYNYCNSTQLENLLQQASIVICRAGYTSIMDYLLLQKKCILIPTPGQTEQEYLAAYLSNKGYVCMGLQHNFALSSLIPAAEKLRLQRLEENSLKEVILDIKKIIEGKKEPIE